MYGTEKLRNTNRPLISLVIITHFLTGKLSKHVLYVLDVKIYILYKLCMHECNRC